MKRKEILFFQLAELGNEFADALADLTQEQLTARPLPGQNPIGWIACHCLRNWDFFIHQRQTNRSLLGAEGEFAHLGRYASQDPTEGNPPPDFALLPQAVEEIFAACIQLIEGLDESALDNLAPYWHHQNFEPVAGNCVRVINHSNTHLRDIWMLRGAMGDKTHFPKQTLYKKGNEERGRFYVPDRATILADRRKKR